MDASTAPLILNDRKIAYFITDRKFRVIEVGGNLQILRQGYNNALGYSLLELVPELIGNEDVLAGLLAGEIPRFELAWVNRVVENDQVAYLTMIDLPHQDASGHIGGLVHLMQDVTDLGRIQQRVIQQGNEIGLLRDELNQQSQKLAAANAELQMLDEIKSGFVSIAAHELRSPLTAITGYLELLLDDGADRLTDLQRDYLNIVRGSAQRLLSITNDLLDLTRIEAGRVELALQPTDLVALIERVAGEYIPQIEAKAQRLTLSALPDLPAALCDGSRTAQIFGNLINLRDQFLAPTDLEHDFAHCISLCTVRRAAKKAAYVTLTQAASNGSLSPVETACNGSATPGTLERRRDCPCLGEVYSLWAAGANLQHIVNCAVLPVRVFQVFLDQRKVSAQDGQVGMSHDLLERVDVHAGA